MRFGSLLALVLMLGLPAWSAELAVMRNGFTIRFQRSEVFESVTRLYLADAPGNFVDIPSGDIVRFETEEPLPEVKPAAAQQAERQSVTLGSAIEAAGRKNHIDPDFIVSLIRAESDFNAKAVSRKGAQGLMQLMPKTASEMGVSDPLDAVENVEGGTRYLASLLARYRNDPRLALAAYNAGANRVEQYHGVPPYQETREYVAKVLADFSRTKTAKSVGASSSVSSSLSRHSRNVEARLSTEVESRRASTYQAQVYP